MNFYGFINKISWKEIPVIEVFSFYKNNRKIILFSNMKSQIWFFFCLSLKVFWIRQFENVSTFQNCFSNHKKDIWYFSAIIILFSLFKQFMSLMRAPILLFNLLYMTFSASIVIIDNRNSNDFNIHWITFDQIFHNKVLSFTNIEN
jgi:hypothetical protein